jgi:hypothetical protein
MVRGASRGLVATPWFAAGTGFVLAAGLWIYSPHAQLRIPDGAVAQVPCTQSSCSAPSGQGSAGALAVTSPGVPIPGPRKSAAAVTQHSGAKSRHTGSAGVTFSFTVLWQRHGMFDAMISAASQSSAGHWQLAFEMPSDKITYVMGANWLPSRTGSGGVASALTARRGAGGNSSGGGTNAGWHDGVQFMVVGNGTPATPDDCVYNGASCGFVTGPAPSGAR